MFAKVFSQILDSSLAEDYQTRHVFEDMLKLCDVNGVVDMTHEAIARRTNVPLEIITHAITDLEKPDSRSRNPAHDGRRIVRLDEHRDWGWLILNYEYYRKIASEEQRREKTLARVQKHRAKGVTLRNACNADVTPVNAGNAMQMNKQMDSKEKLNGLRPKVFNKRLTPEQLDIAARIEKALGTQWDNDRLKWLSRCYNDPNKTQRVIEEVEDAIKRGSIITTTNAQYAEQMWKEFK